MQACVAEFDRGYRPDSGVVDDIQAGRCEATIPHAIERKLIDRLAELQRGGKGRDIGGHLVGKLVALEDPLLEISGGDQEVDGLVSTGPHGTDQVQSWVATHECESHVTILTGDVRSGNDRHLLNR